MENFDFLSLIFICSQKLVKVVIGIAQRKRMHRAVVELHDITKLLVVLLLLHLFRSRVFEVFERRFHLTRLLRERRIQRASHACVGLVDLQRLDDILHALDNTLGILELSRGAALVFISAPLDEFLYVRGS